MSNQKQVQDGSGAVRKDSIPFDQRLAFTTGEAAQLLGVSPISVWRLLRRGKLRANTALRTPLIPKSELLRFLKDAQ